MGPVPLTGLILAGSPPPPGYPSAGAPACLYHSAFEVVLDRQIADLRRQGASSIRVVTGYRADLVREHCVAKGVVLIANPWWASDAALGLEIGAGDCRGDLSIVTSHGQARLRHADLRDLMGVSARARARGARVPHSEAFALAGLPASAEVSAWVPLAYEQTDEARLAPLLPARWRQQRPHAPCTAQSESCAYWSWSEEEMRPPCCTRHLRELLIYTDRLLTRHGITHWLDWGPLLGAVRDGGLIPWDFDVDFGVLLEDRARIAALRAEIASSGYVLNMREDHIWRIHFSPTNHLHADLFPWHAEGDHLEMDGPWADDGFFPPRWLTQLAPVRLFGHEFLAPAPHAEFLAECRYGADFRTPVRYDALRGGPANVAARFVEERRKRARFRADLRTLYDTLAATSLAARYWIEEAPASWPHPEALAAAFEFRWEDRDAFLDAARALAEAGITPRCRYRNHHGDVVGYRLENGYGAFDFFAVDADAAGFTRWRFGGGWEIESRRPAHGFESHRWLERDWLTPENGKGLPASEVVATRPWGALRPERWRLEAIGQVAP
jgi:hypothetical protein